MSVNKVEIILGLDEPKAYISEVYSDEVCRFSDDLSKWLRKNKDACAFPDIMAVAFWLRKGNIEKMKKEFYDGKIHMGRGLIFHITPSNVPVNFIFSYFFGLLSGNSNIVRIPSKKFPQTDILCKAVKEVLQNDDYTNIRDNTMFITYERDKEINDYYSHICDGRIIWGGDGTINTIRKSEIKPKAVEVVFADRYSFGVIQSEKILSMTEKEILNLARGFYNDTYIMDQNACSTPHCIFWLGNKAKEASEIFWNVVKKEEEKYTFEAIKAVDKYTDLCHTAMERTDIEEIKIYGNFLYVVRLFGVPDDMEALRGKYGMFFECGIKSLNDISNSITEKSQTMIYYGIDENILRDFITKSCLKGIDRIVPFGNALDIGVLWDGYDIIRSLSRVVDIRK